MEMSRVAEESGPDEDQQLKSPLLKVIDPDCPEIAGKRGVFSVERTDPLIETFLNDVPNLILQNESYGLIWDRNLKPDQLKYETGVHFVSTRESDRKTSHSTVSFYRDGATGATFAMKTLHKGTPFYPEEIRVGLVIEHPNICSCYGIIVKNGSIHILLEHAGSSLYDERAWIAVCPKRTLSFAKQSFQALDIIHKHGFVHCDIKPDNIMISKHNDNKFTVKLIDFGTCHTKGAILSSSANTTFLYWSPEIWQALDSKEIICRPAMDVYALALTLYYVHTASHLMQRFGNEDLKNVMIKTPDDILLVALPESIPSDLSIVMKSCLDGNHATRSSSQEALKQLTDHTLMSWSSSTGDETYKDSFKRMCSSINRSTTRQMRTEIHTTDVRNTATSKVFQNPPENGTVVGSSIIGEGKRECKTAVKPRKSSCFPSTKYNKASHKGKKSVRPPAKLSLEALQTPTGSTEGKLEKPSVMKFDDKDYSCSILLKNLALHLKGPQQKTSSNANNKNSVRSEVVNTVVRENITDIMVDMPEKRIDIGDNSSWGVNQTVDRSYKFSGDKPKPRMDGKSQLQTKHEAVVRENPGSSKTNLHVECQTVCNVRAQESNARKDCGATTDDMEFLLHALEDHEFSGPEELTDIWCGMLDKDEQAEPTFSTKESNVIVQEITPRNTQTLPSKQEEPMDIDGECSSLSSENRNKCSTEASKGNRKRLADSSVNTSGIPGKTVFLTPSVQDMNNDQLPDFDQILPENV